VGLVILSEFNSLKNCVVQRCKPRFFVFFPKISLLQLTTILLVSLIFIFFDTLPVKIFYIISQILHPIMFKCHHLEILFILVNSVSSVHFTILLAHFPLNPEFVESEKLTNIYKFFVHVLFDAILNFKLIYAYPV
jgi:hypothetical protein